MLVFRWLNVHVKSCAGFCFGISTACLSDSHNSKVPHRGKVAGPTIHLTLHQSSPGPVIHAISLALHQRRGITEKDSYCSTFLFHLKKGILGKPTKASSVS